MSVMHLNACRQVVDIRQLRRVANRNRQGLAGLKGLPSRTSVMS